MPDTPDKDTPDKSDKKGEIEERGGEGEGEDKNLFSEDTFLSLLDARSFASLKIDFRS